MNDSSAEPDLYLAEQVREMLRHDPHVAELGIEVEITGETAVLRGAMTSPEQREAALALVHQLIPRHRVRDELTVADLREPTASEHLP